MIRGHRRSGGRTFPRKAPMVLFAQGLLLSTMPSLLVKHRNLDHRWLSLYNSRQDGHASVEFRAPDSRNSAASKLLTWVRFPSPAPINPFRVRDRLPTARREPDPGAADPWALLSRDDHSDLPTPHLHRRPRRDRTCKVSRLTCLNRRPLDRREHQAGAGIRRKCALAVRKLHAPGTARVHAL